MVRRSWSEDAVRAGLEDAFRKAPGTAVISPSRGSIINFDRECQAAWDLVAASWHFLGKDATPRARETRLMLLTWARVSAQAGQGEASLRAICRDRGWDYRTFRRRVNTAAASLAAQLEAHGISVANLLDAAPKSARE